MKSHTQTPKWQSQTQAQLEPVMLSTLATAESSWILKTANTVAVMTPTENALHTCMINNCWTNHFSNAWKASSTSTGMTKPVSAEKIKTQERMHQMWQEQPQHFIPSLTLSLYCLVSIASAFNSPKSLFWLWYKPRSKTSYMHYCALEYI